MKYQKKIENKDYRFLDEETGSTTPIEILEEPYKGVVFAYTKISFTTDAVRFGFDILNQDAIMKEHYAKDVDFSNYLNQLLTSILLDDLN